MASLFRKDNSPFWQLRFKHPEKGWSKASTELRHDDPEHTAKALALRDKWTARELNDRSQNRTKSDWAWVSAWLDSRGTSDLTRIRYATAWHWVQLWLTLSMKHPEDIRYTDAEAYVNWRMTHRKKSGKKAGRNTANYEVGMLSQVLSEAVRRGMIPSNPIFRVRMKYDPRKQKPPFSDEEANRLFTALREHAPRWMHDAFFIATHLGCRRNETRIHRTAINLNGVLTETDQGPTLVPVVTIYGKGGKDYTIPIPSPLMPYFEQMFREGREWTIDLPFQPSRKVNHFLKKHGLGHLSLHSCRRTRVTRLRDSAVPLEQAKRLVNHSNTLTHELYVRHSVKPLVRYRDAGLVPISLPDPVASDAKACSPSNEEPRQAKPGIRSAQSAA